MKRTLFTLLLMLTSLTTYAASINNLKLNDFYGQNVTLKDYNIHFKKGMIVNVWASWCPPCVKELPSLMRLQQIMPEVTIVAVNVDSDIATAKHFLERRSLPSTVLVNLFDKNSNQLTKIGAKSLPTTYIIDVNGKVVDVIKGYRNWLSEITINNIKTKLKIK